MNTTETIHYDGVSKIFHWLTVILILAAFILGPGDFGRLVRAGADPGARLDIVWHETLGVSIFVLTFLRLLWVALRSGAPDHKLEPKLHFASKLTHVVLWTLLFALPLTAFLTVASEGQPLTLLGGLRITELPGITSLPVLGLADWGDVHAFLGDAIIWLAGGHAVAALYHHFVLKDRVLRSMLP
ncbi:MAG: cytochrome b [Achromobacter pulmonis]